VSLQQYQAKRRFRETPEPKGTVAAGRGPLRFVVQKHRASHLHFDLRLEQGGTLKSWAVPKGPSLNPDDKRLAIMVEDHPLDYLLFEGTIPKGNYGAGTVMVWDEGTYHVPGITNRLENDRSVRDGLYKGHVTFVLHGKKLKGEFNLIKTQRGEENAWLLVKKRDAFASQQPYTGEDRSVLTNRTMEEITQGQAGAQGDDQLGPDGSDAPKGPMPRNVKPMLATPVSQPFDRPNWLFEIKWDGYRAIAEVRRQGVRLYSRKGLAFEERFAPIVDALEYLGHEAVLDGEVVVVDQTGKAQFQLLQQYQNTRKGSLIYYIFDLLYLDGHDLRNLPLVRRKELLARILDHLPNIKLSDHIEEHGIAFFEAVSQRRLEGIIAKDGRSRYTEDVRSRSWLKIKTHMRQEAVIGGFTEPKGGRQGLGSVVLGVYEGDDLLYIGHAGSGLTDHGLADLRSRLDPLVQKPCPFKNRPKANAPVHWVKPEVVCEVSFDAWTADGSMRHPTFLGLRPDKDARTVRRETAKPPEVVLPNGADKVDSQPQAARPQISSTSSQANRQVSIEGHVLQLTNLSKLYWPEDGYTKGDLIHYYREVAEVLLPYLKDRPESLNRHPNGIHGKSFFQKDMSRQPPPEWVETIDIFSESVQKEARTLLCQNEATLVYLANLGCIELNPWSSRVGSLDRPDYLMLDLDPEDVSFGQVVETAQMVRKILDQAGAPALCKTSGKRGLHVVVPLGARYSYEQAKYFAELIARIVNHKLPGSTSVIRNPALRQQRVYLDFLQNGEGKTLASVYSVRPQPGATVSTPLKWSEVKRGLNPANFTIRTLPRRLDKLGDLWKPILSQGIDLPTCLERLTSNLKRQRVDDPSESAP
jgi:bifunctional non-homologous end joining protein LigD